MTGPRRTRSDMLVRWSELHGGYDPSHSRLVSGWLRLVYAAAGPLAAAGVPVALITLSGVVAAAAAALLASGSAALAGLLVAVSALADGLDGAVAVTRRRESPFGALLDAVADRTAELLFSVALWRAGAPTEWAAAALLGAWLLEYVRARAGGLGVTEIGSVTVGERPVRVALAVMGLLLAGLWSPACGLAAALVGMLSVVGCGQLLAVLRHALHEQPG